eukprot:UC4_evm1s1207
MESELEERDRTHEALNREINDLKDKLEATNNIGDELSKSNERTLEDLRARLSDAEDRISEKARLLEDMQS